MTDTDSGFLFGKMKTILKRDIVTVSIILLTFFEKSHIEILSVGQLMSHIVA
jgi:hypothetical protein